MCIDVRVVYGWGRGVVSCMAARARWAVLSSAARTVGVGIVARIAVVYRRIIIVYRCIVIVYRLSSRRHRRVARPPGPP